MYTLWSVKEYGLQNYSVFKFLLLFYPIDAIVFQDLFSNVRRLQIANWVQINGIKYVSLKCFLATGYGADNLPKFVVLHAIVWRNENPIFLCLIVNTVQLNTIVIAYEVNIN